MFFMFSDRDAFLFFVAVVRTRPNLLKTRLKLFFGLRCLRTVLGTYAMDMRGCPLKLLFPPTDMQPTQYPC